MKLIQIMEAKKIKERKVIQHNDILGEPLALGNHVAVARHNSLHVCSILKMTPKQMRVVPVKNKKSSHEGWLVYPHDSLKVDGENALAYILRN